MPRITFGLLNEGSLLRRTLLHIGTFVLGSLAVVGLLSFLLVSIAKGLLPAHSSDSEDKPDKPAPAREGAAESEVVSGKPPGSPRSGSRPKRGRTAPNTENVTGNNPVE